MTPGVSLESSQVPTARSVSAAADGAESSAWPCPAPEHGTGHGPAGALLQGALRAQEQPPRPEHTADLHPRIKSPSTDTRELPRAGKSQAALD